MGEYDLQSMTNSRMVLDEKAGSETAGKSVPTPASQGNRCEDFSLARYRHLTLPSPTSDSSSIVGTLGEIAVAVVWSVGEALRIRGKNRIWWKARFQGQCRIRHCSALKN